MYTSFLTFGHANKNRAIPFNDLFVGYSLIIELLYQEPDACNPCISKRF